MRAIVEMNGFVINNVRLRVHRAKVYFFRIDFCFFDINLYLPLYRYLQVKVDGQGEEEEMRMREHHQAMKDVLLNLLLLLRVFSLSLLFAIIYLFTCLQESLSVPWSIIPTNLFPKYQK